MKLLFHVCIVCMHATPIMQGCVYIDYNADGIMKMVKMMMMTMMITHTPNKTQ